MLPSFKKLQYQQNWFTALFSPMSRVILGDGGQAQFFFKMDWSSNLNVYDPTRQHLIMESRWMRTEGWRSWEVLLGGKKMGVIRTEVLKSLLTLGTEQWSILNDSGEEFLKVAAPEGAALAHVLDNMTNFYNPTHVVTVSTLKGAELATIRMKHGFFNSAYELSMEKGTEQERALVLSLFSAILLMLRK